MDFSLSIATALMIAVKAGPSEMVECLLSEG